MKINRRRSKEKQILLLKVQVVLRNLKLKQQKIINKRLTLELAAINLKAINNISKVMRMKMIMEARRNKKKVKSPHLLMISVEVAVTQSNLPQGDVEGPEEKFQVKKNRATMMKTLKILKMARTKRIVSGKTDATFAKEQEACFVVTVALKSLI